MQCLESYNCSPCMDFKLYRSDEKDNLVRPDTTPKLLSLSLSRERLTLSSPLQASTGSHRPARTPRATWRQPPRRRLITTLGWPRAPFGKHEYASNRHGNDEAQRHTPIIYHVERLLPPQTSYVQRSRPLRELQLGISNRLQECPRKKASRRF